MAVSECTAVSHAATCACCMNPKYMPWSETLGFVRRFPIFVVATCLTLHAFTVQSTAYRDVHGKCQDVPHKRRASVFVVYTVCTLDPPTIPVHISRCTMYSTPVSTRKLVDLTFHIIFPTVHRFYRPTGNIDEGSQILARRHLARFRGVGVGSPRQPRVHGVRLRDGRAALSIRRP